MQHRLSLALIALLFLGGCGPEVSKEDLGTIVTAPTIAGADKPHQMPKLGPPLKQQENKPLLGLP